MKHRIYVAVEPFILPSIFLVIFAIAVMSHVG